MRRHSPERPEGVVEIVPVNRTIYIVLYKAGSKRQELDNICNHEKDEKHCQSKTIQKSIISIYIDCGPKRAPKFV